MKAILPFKNLRKKFQGTFLWLNVEIRLTFISYQKSYRRDSIFLRLILNDNEKYKEIYNFLFVFFESWFAEKIDNSSPNLKILLLYIEKPRSVEWYFISSSYVKNDIRNEMKYLWKFLLVSLLKYEILYLFQCNEYTTNGISL